MEGCRIATFVQLSFLILQVSTLQWSSCGDKSDPIKVGKLTVDPDVLKFPGPVTINGLAKLKKNLTEPIKVELEVRKKMFWGGYVRIPCEDGYGSCTYENVCAFSPYTDACPTIFKQYHLPCKCPITQGIYSVKGLTLDVQSIHIPKFLVNGKYKIHIAISSQEHQIGCYDVVMSLK